MIEQIRNVNTNLQKFLWCFFCCLDFHSVQFQIDDLPVGLIRARIALRLTQKQLAERVGLKEQQIQRYEETDYVSASFSRLQEIIKALGLDIEEKIFLPKVQQAAAKHG